jgi:hypothetical protein
MISQFVGDLDKAICCVCYDKVYDYRIVHRGYTYAIFCCMCDRWYCDDIGCVLEYDDRPYVNSEQRPDKKFFEGIGCKKCMFSP